MRRLLLWVVILVSGWAGILTDCQPPLKNIPARITAEELFRYPSGYAPVPSAHRGGPESGYPENCIETFEHTLRYACAIIECDIRMTKDRRLVLMHDHTLDRTTNGEGLVRNHTLDEIRTLRLRDNEGNLTRYTIPTLDEVLQWSREKTIVQLDIKPEVPFDSVVAVVHRNHASRRVVMITYSADDAQTIYRLDSTLMISVSLKQLDDLSRLETFGVSRKRMVAFTGVAEPDTRLIDTLHSLGISVICGTIGNLDRKAEVRGDRIYESLMEKGVNVIATDRPKEVDEVSRRFAINRQLKRLCND